ncbi:MAG: sulfotransferase domain-containing protein, partial [Bacteroidota bacterium]
RSFSDYLIISSLLEQGFIGFKIGEASPAYLAAEGVPERMHRYLPDVDLYLMVRNPIDRAFSHYVFAVKQGYEPVDLTFEEAIRTDQVVYKGFERKRPYLENGFYDRHLKRYDAVYGSGKVKVLFFEDLRKDPLGFAQKFYREIGVNAAFEPNTGTQFAKSGLPKNKAIHQLIKGNNPLKSMAKQLVPKQYRKRLKTNIENANLEKPAFPTHLRQELIDLYAADVQALAKRTGRNLDHWLK